MASFVCMPGVSSSRTAHGFESARTGVCPRKKVGEAITGGSSGEPKAERSALSRDCRGTTFEPSCCARAAAAPQSNSAIAHQCFMGEFYTFHEAATGHDYHGNWTNESPSRSTGRRGRAKAPLPGAWPVNLGFLYIDTGAMYRAVALWAIRLNVALSDMHRLEQLAEQAVIEFVAGENRVLLNGEDVTTAIRGPGIGEAASKISPVPAVRRALVKRQRELGQQASVVMEGRDIGTIVFPEADVKIFLDAHPEQRAERRSLELEIPMAAAASEMHQRDTRDRTRPESPLVQAPDAVYVDTTGLNVDEVEQALLKIIRERTSNGKERTH